MTKRILLGAQRMGVSRETLLVTLKVTGAELLDLTYGGRVLTPEQIQKLEQHTGKTMQELADLGTPDSETERAKPATKDTKAATNDTKPATENVTPRPGMKLGVVKWFNDQKGFGFITNAEGKDVFVHHSCIEGEGFQTLQDGEQVEFEEVEGAKGPKAERVRRLVRP